MLNYQKKLKEFDLDLTSTDLDPAFVSKAKDLEEKIKKDSLTDGEVNEIDAELCKLFDNLHEFEEVDAPEMTELQRQNRILEAKDKINSVSTIAEIKNVIEEFKGIEEVAAFGNSKIEMLEQQHNDEAEKEQAKKQVIDLIQSAQTIEDLKEKAKTLDDKDPWVVQQVNARIEELRKDSEQKNSEIQDKLLQQKTWTYDQLRAIGIEPTGTDMVAHDIKLVKRYMFKVYEAAGKVR